VDDSLQGLSEGVRERNLTAMLGALTKLVPEYQASETLLALLDSSLA
jgi:hypothetical protein